MSPYITTFMPLAKTILSSYKELTLQSLLLEAQQQLLELQQMKRSVRTMRFMCIGQGQMTIIHHTSVVQHWTISLINM